jgi:hypothetical protein
MSRVAIARGSRRTSKVRPSRITVKVTGRPDEACTAASISFHRSIRIPSSASTRSPGNSPAWAAGDPCSGVPTTGKK